MTVAGDQLEEHAGHAECKNQQGRQEQGEDQKFRALLLAAPEANVESEADDREDENAGTAQSTEDAGGIPWHCTHCGQAWSIVGRDSFIGIHDAR